MGVRWNERLAAGKQATAPSQKLMITVNEWVRLTEALSLNETLRTRRTLRAKMPPARKAPRSRKTRCNACTSLATRPARAVRTA